MGGTYFSFSEEGELSGESFHDELMELCRQHRDASVHGEHFPLNKIDLNLFNYAQDTVMIEKGLYTRAIVYFKEPLGKKAVGASQSTAMSIVAFNVNDSGKPYHIWEKRARCLDYYRDRAAVWLVGTTCWMWMSLWKAVRGLFFCSSCSWCCTR